LPLYLVCSGKEPVRICEDRQNLLGHNVRAVSRRNLPKCVYDSSAVKSGKSLSTALPTRSPGGILLKAFIAVTNSF
jgi:hypothetical protein